jgi:hemoglobin
MGTEESHQVTLYERVGGDAFFHALVDRFYQAVAGDPLLRPIYPDDLVPGAFNLAEFLVQYWGGPPRYNARRGHPRLRMRHMPFRIGRAERDAWLRHMTEAVNESGVPKEVADELVAYFDMASTMLINQPG